MLDLWRGILPKTALFFSFSLFPSLASNLTDFLACFLLLPLTLLFSSLISSSSVCLLSLFHFLGFLSFLFTLLLNNRENKAISLSQDRGDNARQLFSLADWERGGF